MMQPYDHVTEQQKEHCAIVTMRLMLTEFAKNRNISFNDAMMLFAETPVYSVLFDFESELWKEGPRYLYETFVEYLDSREDMVGVN